jgi:hypothetical protein
MAMLNLNCQKVDMIFLPKRGSIIRMEQPPKDLSRIETKSDKIPEIKKSTWTIWQTWILHKHSGPLTHCRDPLSGRWTWYDLVMLIQSFAFISQLTGSQHHINTIYSPYTYHIPTIYPPYIHHTPIIPIYSIYTIYPILWQSHTDSYSVFTCSHPSFEPIVSLKASAPLGPPPQQLKCWKPWR